MSHFSVVLLVGLLIFTIYRRIRRNVGWQLLSTRKLRVRTILFLIIGLVFLSGGLTHPLSLLSDFLGIAIGGFLAVYGMRLTRYEKRENKWYYQPNTWIGSTVTIIFLGRLGYRFFKMYDMGLFTGEMYAGSTPPSTYDQMNFGIGNSWTTGLYLIMFAYYIVYFTLIIRKRKSLDVVPSN